MAEFIFGLILLAIPFVFLSFFEDKKRGFVYILFFLFIFHAFLAILTQFFGIFYYWIIISASLLADIILAIIYLKKKNNKKISLDIKKIDWVFLAVIFIAFLTLYQVHYNYTGKINLATDKTVSYHEVKNMRYAYPYFSDEWYAVSLIKSSIDFHSLPLKNPDGTVFHNLEIFFHSFLAEVVLFFKANPLLSYNFFSIFFNSLIIILIYLFLRLNNVSRLSSGISAMSLLYITCGANLPGLWHLIPVSLGIIFSLFGFCFLAFSLLPMAISSLFMVVLFYPPLFLFLGLGMAVFLFLKNKERFLRFIGHFLIVLFLAVPVFYIILMLSPFAGFLKLILSKFYYVSFTGLNMPQYDFYNIIPWPAIFLAVLGLVFVVKQKKWLFYPFVLALIFWFFYSISIHRIMIEYERVVLFASVLAAIISGFGLEQLEKYANLKLKSIKLPIIKYVEIVFLILFLALAPFYTQRDGWKKLILINSETKAVFFPKSPANNYLTEDDIRIFKDIKNKKFLSLPWKGTVIGVATQNYPLVTKEGTISIGKEETVNIFLNSNCADKTKIAKGMALDYVYIYEFACPGFEKINESKEGFMLYKFNDQKNVF